MVRYEYDKLDDLIRELKEVGVRKAAVKAVWAQAEQPQTVVRAGEMVPARGVSVSLLVSAVSPYNPAEGIPEAQFLLQELIGSALVATNPEGEEIEKKAEEKIAHVIAQFQKQYPECVIFRGKAIL
jgi:hypothetical protein